MRVLGAVLCLVAATVGGPTAPANARPPVTEVAAVRQAFVLPVAAAITLRPFEAPAHRYGAGHRGVDLAARPGTSVVAPAAGTIAYAGLVAGRPVLSIDHGDARRSAIEPVTSSVAVGDRIEAGAAVGVVGAGGHCAETCVHWGVRVNGIYVDPMVLLQPRVVLLPLRGGHGPLSRPR